MEKNQKRLIAVVLCIIGIVGTIMAGKDAAARQAETGGQTEAVQTEAVQAP